MVSAAESSRGETTRRLCSYLLVGDGFEGPPAWGWQWGVGSEDEMQRMEFRMCRYVRRVVPTLQATPVPQKPCVGPMPMLLCPGCDGCGGTREEASSGSCARCLLPLPFARLQLWSSASGAPSSFRGCRACLTCDTAWRASKGHPDFPAVTTVRVCLFRCCLPGTEFGST